MQGFHEANITASASGQVTPPPSPHPGLRVLSRGPAAAGLGSDMGVPPAGVPCSICVQGLIKNICNELPL
jgi:hypothetical protein